MFSRIQKWFRDNREWNRKHRASWEEARKPGDDGLSTFQRTCEEAVAATIRDAGGAVVERTVSPFGDRELIVYLQVAPIGLDVWIAADGAQAGSGPGELRLEEWDALTPEDLTRMLVEHVATNLRGGSARR